MATLAMNRRTTYPVLKKRGIRIQKPEVTSSVTEGLKQRKQESKPELNLPFKIMIGATYLLSVVALGLAFIGR